MFKNVQADSDSMIVEIREFLELISEKSPVLLSPVPRYINTAKGLIYVQLYGVIENTILRTLSKTIDYINNEKISLSNLKPVILALALNNELDSLIHVNKKKWDKRYDLFLRLDVDSVIEISNVLVPTDGKNIGISQLHSIWRTFNMKAPIFDDPTFGGRLTEIVTNRINIAQGNVPASDIGKSLTISDLNDRISEVSAFCSYFISTFNEYVTCKRYLIGDEE